MTTSEHVVRLFTIEDVVIVIAIKISSEKFVLYNHLHKEFCFSEMVLLDRTLQVNVNSFMKSRICSAESAESD